MSSRRAHLRDERVGLRGCDTVRQLSGPVWRRGPTRSAGGGAPFYMRTLKTNLRAHRRTRESVESTGVRLEVLLAHGAHAHHPTHAHTYTRSRTRRLTALLSHTPVTAHSRQATLLSLGVLDDSADLLHLVAQLCVLPTGARLAHDAVGDAPHRLDEGDPLCRLKLVQDLRKRGGRRVQTSPGLPNRPRPSPAPCLALPPSLPPPTHRSLPTPPP